MPERAGVQTQPRRSPSPADAASPRCHSESNAPHHPVIPAQAGIQAYPQHAGGHPVGLRLHNAPTAPHHPVMPAQAGIQAYP
jgi:hypothetical protein